MSNVDVLEQEIRDIFNISRRHRISQRNKAAFNQTCSAMDVIGDTEMALNEFASCEENFDTGISYILSYGVLQALFLQQDAIKHLAQSLGLKFELPAELRKIRNLRNDAIGHPTERNFDRKKKIKSFNHISRITLSLKGFQLLSTYSNNDDYVITKVNFLEIINQQAKFAEQLLSAILDSLRHDENAHRKKFMNEKLTEIFHKSLSYIFQKVSEGILGPKDPEFAQENFKIIKKTISQFEMKLKERDEEETIKYVLEELSYPIEKVTSFLKNEGLVDQRAAEIFVEYIRGKVDELKAIAKEIDEEYQKEV